jgi:hypothetical protein
LASLPESALWLARPLSAKRSRKRRVVSRSNLPRPTDTRFNCNYSYTQLIDITCYFFNDLVIPEFLQT